MKKINFKQFRLFKDISQAESNTVDVSRDIAEMLYQNATGLMAHDIALRIYHSGGDVEFSEEEIEYLQKILPIFTTPIFQDSLKANIHD